MTRSDAYYLKGLILGLALNNGDKDAFGAVYRAVEILRLEMEPYSLCPHVIIDYLEKDAFCTECMKDRT